MSEFEREELTNRINAMSLEEKMLVCSLLPSELLAIEVKVRLQEQEQKIFNVTMALK